MAEKFSAIKIRPIKLEDYSSVLAWSKDEAFCLANDWDLNREPDEVYNWWQQCVHHKKDDFIRMGIELDQRLVGYADLACIVGDTAELGIAIGESSLWGKGIGFIASKKMMDYANKKLGIHVFHAETHETNHRSRRMLEKLGFKEINRNGSEWFKGIEARLIQYELDY
ncbi:GNAT family N-acetyltransferase [Ornithinibacillus bavariensis]|uniref:Acetyltransferase ribosomal protein N-acetylase n=1 Tax=Ornithinibacillus bavariensis TaxID=545502 RepID=A0A920C8I4_9BACI|nr:GNAT family N-acetyltransferase [Ornithinibacillus bavariensis]GIO28254.1 acetyltransferase ribosomal protein N-acetylase [Ornithinibacillus bavariensis]